MIMLMMISMIIMMLVSINSKCNIIEAKGSEVENDDSKSKVGNHVLMQPNSPLESHFHASVPISTNTANLEINMMNDVDQRRGKRFKLRRGITMDSGAANNVMPRRMVRNPSAIRPSRTMFASQTRARSISASPRRKATARILSSRSLR